MPFDLLDPPDVDARGVEAGSDGADPDGRDGEEETPRLEDPESGDEVIVDGRPETFWDLTKWVVDFWRLAVGRRRRRRDSFAVPNEQRNGK